MAAIPPTGADLATYMARSDPGDFGEYVQASSDYVSGLAVMDPYTEAHRLAVLATAAEMVRAKATNGVEMTDFGVLFARRRPFQLELLLTMYGVGGMA